MTSFVDDDGNYLDYSGDDFNLTKQVFSILDFNVKGDVSLNFNLSNNNINQKALGYAGPQQLVNPLISKRPFNVTRNGNVISKGYIVVQQDKGSDLNCFYYSGNANWFTAFQFNCKDIRNPDYTVKWHRSVMITQNGARSGICFPFIDWIFSGQRFSNYFQQSNLLRQGTGSDSSIGIMDIYPCLFMHTLVEELCKVANIRISGTLLNDGLYKTIIVTPSGPDLIDPETQSAITPLNPGVSVLSQPNITIGAVAPDLKAIEVIKWLIITFGCIPTYDIYSQTLNLDVSVRRDKSDSADWSQYLQSFTVDYDKTSEHNYITSKQGPEQSISDYNSVNDLSYGDLDIQSLNDDGSEKTLYNSPFLSVKDVIGTSVLQWGTPDVALYKCTDGDGYAYGSVTNNGGNPQFNGTFPFAGAGAFNNGLIFRADGPVYSGYHFSDSVTGASSTLIRSDSDYISNDTGNIYIQKITKVNAGPRVLIFAPATDTNFFTSKNSFKIGTTTGILNVGYAYYSKVLNTFSGDPFKKSLNYGDINLRFYYCKNINESYLNYIRKAITSPYFLGRFLLPEAIFQKFNFEFVYLNTRDLNGYFLVGRIYAYKDSKTEVEVDLYSID